MTIEEFKKKDYITEYELADLTLEQMFEITKLEDTHHKAQRPMDYAARLKISLAQKERWFKKKNNQ